MSGDMNKFHMFRPDGSKLKLPPVLLGQLGNDPKKKTVLLYGHLDGDKPRLFL